MYPSVRLYSPALVRGSQSKRHSSVPERKYDENTRNLQKLKLERSTRTFIDHHYFVPQRVGTAAVAYGSMLHSFCKE